MTNKVALITGAGRRVGAVIAGYLHAQGMNVIIHYRHSRQYAEQLAAQLNQQRQNSAAILSADLNDMTQVKPLITAAGQVWGQLDVLINNASTYYPSEIGNVSETHWEDLMASNLKAPFFLAQAAISYLQKSQGSIINIIDINAFRPKQDYSVYCIAKAGLVMLTKSLAKELAPSIRVNAVAPGTVLWPDEVMVDENLAMKVAATTPMGHIGTPDDIAKAVWFFINDAHYVTGQILAIDGGKSL